MAGILDVFGASPGWALTSLDDGHTIEGQFPVLDAVEDVSANYSGEPSLGRGQPVLQYDGDDDETLSFTAKVWAQHQGFYGASPADTIEDLVAKIKSTVRADPDLGRPHVYAIQIGSSIVMPA